ncbi:CAP domain-containing protein [Aurantiacibacter poecillastricola]|uniref:CAP domain-containing protein n=1 Tax=Aurantiacibacter poecillastricola TaxID=3064385 RepID=UPI00273E5603|nr:CAP domain-containing protein [Aurantiacibacter sp. 219JJ12-13]MDP5262263.1 CAP domain-containing protein [Aurantiacibacter sp. 219JJ12-13]
MSEPTDLEQLHLELINDARLDPMGNAARYLTSYSPLLSPHPNIQGAMNYFGVTGSALLSAYQALSPAAPLAWNGNLGDAALTHTQVMIDTDLQTHQAPGEPGLGQRANNAGYTGWYNLAENVYAYAQDPLHGHAGFMVDWGNGPNGMQNPAGHRISIMNPVYTEIGIGVIIENNPATQVGPQVTTQNFGNRGKSFLLGVAYGDSDGNDFYSRGEGLAGLSITQGGARATSTSSGGYAFEVTRSSNVVFTLTGGGLVAPATLAFDSFDENVKADVVNGDRLKISADATVSGFTFIEALGISGLSITAGEGAQTFLGNRGNDRFDGGANVDVAVLPGTRSAYSVTQKTTGVFEISGPEGTDTLVNIEYAQFADTTLRLLPGTGVSVNFETANPSVYQSAMNAIRDFDGNSLGGNGSWLRIGAADVNGDGDIDNILVNDAIGRFATVGTADNGLVYFSDYGWAGETRVAGIYIDPLVQSGQVVAGSADDSQQRFHNDLEIENINRVLGADDYDGDGLQEVYFALTDSTAYLHAYMHADGNIRYANYQTEQQVIEFLETNGFDESTYGDWFAPPGSFSLDPASSAAFAYLPDHSAFA